MTLGVSAHLFSTEKGVSMKGARLRPRGHILVAPLLGGLVLVFPEQNFLTEILGTWSEGRTRDSFCGEGV